MHVSVGAGDGNRTRMTSLEEGSPQGWDVLVVLAELPPAAAVQPLAIEGSQYAGRSLRAEPGMAATVRAVRKSSSVDP
jgi:hypothetical protein